MIHDKFPLSDYAKVQKVLIDGTVYFDRDNEVSGRGAKQAEKQRIKIVILQPRRTATSPNVPGLFHSPQ